MGRDCIVCKHPDVKEINEHIMHGSATMVELEERYGVSKWALHRHKKNHLGSVIQEFKQEAKRSVKEDLMRTVDAYNAIIAFLPSVLEESNPTLSQIMDALEGRAKVLGERVGPAEISIKWGKGSDEQYSDQPQGLTDEAVEEMEIKARGMSKIASFEPEDDDTEH